MKQSVVQGARNTDNVHDGKIYNSNDAVTLIFWTCYVCEILPISYWLFVIVLQLSDSGLYTCLATSSSGETSWSAFLDVRGSFIFLKS